MFYWGILAKSGKIRKKKIKIIKRKNTIWFRFITIDATKRSVKFYNNSIHIPFLLKLKNSRTETYLPASNSYRRPTAE